MNIKIGNFNLSAESKTFIVAELSANHNQKFEIALETVKAAKECGADAVKLQTYTADTLTIDSQRSYFQIKQGTLWDGKTLYQLYREAFTPWEWQPQLKKTANQLGLECFSSPFDKSAVDFLEKMEVPAYKVASFEISDIPLIEYIASKGKPVIISTGIATLEDITEAIQACQRMNNHQIIILKCTSAYPAPLDEINLKTIPHLQESFKCMVGLSDHTVGIAVPIAAVALGAKIIEKHFILDRKLGGPDSAFSIEPADFKNMVQSIRQTETALGNINYDLSERVKKNRIFARSLFVTENIKKGEPFTSRNVRSIRPGHGLPPKYLKEILGKHAGRDIEKGTPLSFDLIE
jgi:pseudaminic acid synthase